MGTWSGGGAGVAPYQKPPSSNIQDPEKLQIPITGRLNFCFFSGSWSLEFGAFPRGDQPPRLASNSRTSIASMPAARIACIPRSVSSYARQRAGAMPMRRAASRKISGAGFWCKTSSLAGARGARAASPLVQGRLTLLVQGHVPSGSWGRCPSRCLSNEDMAG